MLGRGSHGSVSRLRRSGAQGALQGLGSRAGSQVLAASGGQGARTPDKTPGRNCM